MRRNAKSTTAPGRLRAIGLLGLLTVGFMVSAASSFAGGGRIAVAIAAFFLVAALRAGFSLRRPRSTSAQEWLQEVAALAPPPLQGALIARARKARRVCHGSLLIFLMLVVAAPCAAEALDVHVSPVVLAFPILGMFFLLFRATIRAAWIRFHRASIVGDARRMREAAADLIGAAFLGHPATVSLRVSVLFAEERWREAIALLESLDRNALSRTRRHAHDNALAWALANAGDAERALPIITDVLAHRTLEARHDAEDTLAVVLLKMGKAEEAAPLLESLVRGSMKGHPSTAYFLGVAFRQLGREEDALRSFERAETLGTGGPWTVRARAESSKGSGPLSAGPPAA